MNGVAWGLALAVLLVGWLLVEGAGQGRWRGGVWLLAAVGLLVGAFGQVAAVLWGAGRPLVVVLAVAWVLGAAAPWMSRRATARRGTGRTAWDATGRAAGSVLVAAFGGLLGVAWWELALPHGRDVTGPGAVVFAAAPLLLAGLCVLGVRVHGGLRRAARLPATRSDDAEQARRQVGASLGLFTVVAGLGALAALGAFGSGAAGAVLGAVLLLLAAVWALAALFDLDRQAPGAATVRAAGVLTTVLPVAATAAVVGPQLLANASL
ncbi:hypothetical protein ACNHYB_12095 [Isoptericola jiangsuensis]|uniref:hypothetical protein n=1 Tax=Isoptericola jiangsuensis TaxID=548579 RepID=UPI003AAC0C9B